MSQYFQEKALPLREIITRLEKVYCGSIGAEFMHIHNLDEVNLIVFLLLFVLLASCTCRYAFVKATLFDLGLQC